MSDSVPPAPTLLAATARYLEDELMPSLEGYHRFQTRIAINVLRIVERELRLGAAHDAAARERLLALLQDAPTPTAPSLALADALRDGRLDPDAPGVATHLRAALAEALAINNPRWITKETPP